MSATTTPPAAPSINFAVDDRDLDDAELWAVIDAAALSTRSRKPLRALPNSATTSPSPFPRNPKPYHHKPPSDGEVVQPWSHPRPNKVPRISDPDHRMVVLRHSPNYSPEVTPPADRWQSKFTVKEVSPVVESPPPMDRWQSRLAVKEVSPVSKRTPPVRWQGEEKENVMPMHSLSGQFPSVSMFKEYQNAAMAILEKTDYTMLSGSPYIKKSGWRKISFFFNISYEIKDKSIEFDENRNVQRAEFVVRAHMRCGRFSDGWGSCERREKRFSKPNHDIPSTAETRAKNKACQDLLGIGEYRPGPSNAQR